MSASGNLCSIDDVKTYLGLTGTDHDTRLTALVEAASEAIESFCRRQFTQTQHTEYHDGMGSGVLLLDHHPAQSVTSVKVDANRAFASAEAIDSDDYVVYGDEGMIQLVAGTFAAGVRNVQVVYTAGYSAIPDDVAQACVQLVAAWFHRGRQGADGIDTERLGDYSASYAARGLPQPVVELLTPYLELYV